MWNWQYKKWPEFSYPPEEFSDYENLFLQKSGIILGSLKHISEEDQDTLKVNLMCDEAFKTSEIEGEILDRDSLQSSIRKQFGLQIDHRKIPPAEHGVAEMMVDLYRNFQTELNHEPLYNWHQMLMNGRRDLQAIGGYRTHSEPMQVVAGSIDQPKVYFEGPPSDDVPDEMDRFIDWFNRTGPEEREELSGLLRAGIAHLYFESIHPFEDGNGRIGRGLSEKALSQSLGRPTLIAISSTIEAGKKEYYEALHRASTGLEISGWLHYFCQMVLDAQEHTQSMIDFLIEKGKFYRAYADQLNDRQAKVVERMFKEGVSGFKGGLSADNYRSITGTTRATATRDLQNLVEMGAFIRIGERRYTRYFLNIDHEVVKPERD
ncbi:MAG: DUF4172 domain-containing protein [Balneolaceae bacterium]